MFIWKIAKYSAIYFLDVFLQDHADRQVHMI